MFRILLIKYLLEKKPTDNKSCETQIVDLKVGGGSGVVRSCKGVVLYVDDISDRFENF